MSGFDYTQLIDYKDDLTYESKLDIPSTWPDWDGDQQYESGDEGLATGPYLGVVTIKGITCPVFQGRDSNGVYTGYVVIYPGPKLSKDKIPDSIPLPNNVPFYFGKNKATDPIVGTNKDDKLKGTSGDDEIRGRGGDDTLKGKAGNDILNGGKHDDKLLGGANDDFLNGKAGRDLLKGGTGDDCFQFDFKMTKNSAKKNWDKIADFDTADDTICLKQAKFSDLPEGDLSDTDTHVTYKNKALFYDDIKFAKFTGDAPASLNDIHIEVYV
ncbi:MAG: hypothetical protein KDJ86_13905 [Bauldia sp.]|uniref:calcium-binding protein n=1 Tax=Bauldia sp. TaxID=2575872 RepID=UPI001DBFF192|nr:hypothetical protein [Bauldia sp.]MCB1496878.1 hypothetical protein [Bauldia sp.]